VRFRRPGVGGHPIFTQVEGERKRPPKPPSGSVSGMARFSPRLKARAITFCSSRSPSSEGGPRFWSPSGKGGARVPRKVLKKSPQRGAPAPPARGAPGPPRPAAFRQPATAIAGRAPPKSAAVDNLQQSAPLQAPKRTADIPPVEAGPPGEVVVRSPRR